MTHPLRREYAASKGPIFRSPVSNTRGIHGHFSVPQHFDRFEHVPIHFIRINPSKHWLRLAWEIDGKRAHRCSFAIAQRADREDILANMIRIFADPHRSKYADAYAQLIP